MTAASPDELSSPGRVQRHPDRWINLAGIVLIASVVVAALWLILSLQHRVEASKSLELSNLALVLSQETERAFQALETVQLGLVERMQRDDITTGAQLRTRMQGADVYALLRDRAEALPYVEAITLIDLQGKLVNFSRFRPAPAIDVADRDYFKALKADPALDTFLSEPVQNRASGTWTIYLARKFRDPQGEMLGLVLGAMRLDYFEQFYRTIAPGDGGAIGLFRRDGMLLVRHPRVPGGVGKRYPFMDAATAEGVASLGNRAIHRVSDVDHQERLVTTRQLSQYPVTVAVSTSYAAISRSWRQEGLVIGAGAALLTGLLGACVMLGKRQLTAQYRLSAAANHLARHDTLTGLPNRARFSEHLRELVAPGQRGAEPLALLLLDLDYFKSINDTLGHPCGDALLRVIARRLVDGVGTQDLVARLGGDEFAIVQRGAYSRVATQELAQRLVDAIAVPCIVDGNQVVTSASIGMTFAPIDGRDADQLLKNADLALYRAKADGRGGWRTFEADMQKDVQARRVLELALREALQQDGFELFYQPVVDARSRRLEGFEALLRWKQGHPAAASAAQFIPVAEETGLIVPLGKWVLEQACREASNWPADTRLAVNVSAIQLRSGDLVDHVCSALKQGGLPAHRLELEITESILLREDALVRNTLDQLRRMGVSMSLDDFGTGYSSLSYLRRFPADRIKIDITFVRDICHDVDSARIVRAIIDLAQSLGMSTTAEGVETQAQWDELVAAGCDEIQGYEVGRPGPPSVIPSFLARYRSGHVQAVTDRVNT